MTFFKTMGFSVLVLLVYTALPISFHKFSLIRPLKKRSRPKAWI